ncbi:MAG: hypothetical protein FWD75_06555 [Propionibacteriaceae bacterium]|nr:hypothetical protein [Propionibacteriaceae bacterium]
MEHIATTPSASADLRAWTPVQVDVELKKLGFLLDDARLDMDRLHRFDRRTRRTVVRDGVTAAEVRAARHAMNRLRAQAAPLEAEHDRRGGWTRAYLVPGPDGHIHASTTCSTCNRRGRPTMFKWLTEFSGMDEATVVEAAGERACTVCYPNAPVEVLTRPSTIAECREEARKKSSRAAAAQARRDARETERLAKAVTLDGSPLVIRFEDTLWNGVCDTRVERFATRRAAENWATSTLFHQWYAQDPGRGDDMPRPYLCDKLVRALSTVATHVAQVSADASTPRDVLTRWCAKARRDAVKTGWMPWVEALPDPDLTISPEELPSLIPA